MGDKTQVATVMLAARYDALAAVVAGTTLGMMIANVPAVLLGDQDLVKRHLEAAGLFGSPIRTAVNAFLVNTGEKLVMIGPDTPIWSTEPGDASLVVPGAYVVINARKLDDGSYTATNIMIEKNGTRPTL